MKQTIEINGKKWLVLGEVVSKEVGKEIVLVKRPNGNKECLAVRFKDDPQRAWLLK